MRLPRVNRAIVAVVLVGATACGGGTNASACADVAEDAAAMVQDILADVGDMSLSEADQERMNELQSRFEERGAELDERAQEACESEEQFAQLVSDRLEDVEAEGEVGQLFLEGMRGQFDEGSPPPADAATES